MTLEPINPESLVRPRGWTHGLLAPPGARTLYVAGMTAADGSGHVPDVNFVEQFDLTLTNILAVLADAGALPEHVARMTVYVSDLDAYRSNLKVLGERWRGRMGRHYPAMALVEVSRLLDPNALVEIETTAVLPAADEAT